MAQHLVHSSHPVGQSPYWLFSPPACIPFARLSLHYSRLCTTRVCTPHHRNEETSRPVPTLMNIASAAASLRPDNYQPVSFTPAFVLSTPFPDSSFVSRDIRIRTVPIPILSALLAYQRMRNVGVNHRFPRIVPRFEDRACPGRRGGREKSMREMCR